MKVAPKSSSSPFSELVRRYTRNAEICCGNTIRWILCHFCTRQLRICRYYRTCMRAFVSLQELFKWIMIYKARTRLTPLLTASMKITVDVNCSTMLYYISPVGRLSSQLLSTSETSSPGDPSHLTYERFRGLLSLRRKAVTSDDPNFVARRDYYKFLDVLKTVSESKNLSVLKREMVINTEPVPQPTIQLQMAWAPSMSLDSQPDFSRLGGET